MCYICYEIFKKDFINLVIFGNDLIMEEFVFVVFGVIIFVVYGLLQLFIFIFRRISVINSIYVYFNLYKKVFKLYFNVYKFVYICYFQGILFYRQISFVLFVMRNIVEILYII